MLGLLNFGTLFLLLCGCLCTSGCRDNPYFKDAGPLVKTSSGSIVGKYVKVFDTEVAAFLGIPFGKPPIGEKRFTKAEPVEPWGGVLMANENAPPCMQYSSRHYSWLPTTVPSEDCLYLNVWTPTKCSCSANTSDKLPVMVWIHGGGYSSGSNDMDIYDGSIISSYGEVIVVSMNYRLGIFGFLNGGTDGAPGNAGLLDQNLALRWVQENIEYFGGDPQRVTLFGESAGAISISMHMISPLSRDLFQRAILQSGSAYNPQIVDSPQAAYLKANMFAKLVGCANDTDNLGTDPAAVVGCLKHIDAMSLAQAESSVTSQSITLFMPSSANEFIANSHIESFESGDLAPVDVLIGGVKNEGTVFLNYMMTQLFPSDQDPTITLTQGRGVFPVLFRMMPEQLLGKVADFYLQNVTEDDSVGVTRAIADAFGDYIFNCPMLFLSEKLKNPYVYWITHRSIRDPNAEWMGVPHFYEVAFVFGKPIVDIEHYTPEDGRFSGDLIQKWVNFARNGYPLNDDSKLVWPKFSSLNPTVLELNPRSTKPIPFPRQEPCELWRSIFQLSSVVEQTPI